MPKITWNNLVSTHRNAFYFAAAVPRVLPRPFPKFDGNGKILPTPYGLFEKWLHQSLNGDWAICQITGVFAVGIALQTDTAVITSRYLSVSGTKPIFGTIVPAIISYHAADYVGLARLLGYKI